MYLLPEAAVCDILRSLTKEQCHTFITSLSDALVTVTTESSLPQSQRLIQQPLRNTLTTKENNLSLFMPVSNTTNTGIKIVTAANSGGIVGVINLFTGDGKILGILSAAELTAFRTALAVMTLFVRCPPDVGREGIVVFGAGRQAEWHVRLALLLFPGMVRRVTFVNRGRKRLEEFEEGTVRQLRGIYPGVVFETLAKEGTDGYEEQLRGVLAASDVIFSCTPSTEPNFPFEYLRPDGSSEKKRFISLIGSYKPHMREIDTETLLSGGKVYVDSKEACLEESGELITAGVGEDQLIEVGNVYAGYGAIEVPDGCNLVFKCVGMGVMDLVIAKKVLDVGVELERAVRVDGFQG